MSDYSELKRLAEAATQGLWMYWGETGHEIFASPEGKCGMKIFMLNRDARREDAAFIAAANPAAVRALIAENERLKQHIVAMQADPGSWQSGYNEGRRMGTKTAYSEREQFKAENEALRRGMKGDYDLDAWINWAKEAEPFRKDAERLDWAASNCDIGYRCEVPEGEYCSTRDKIDAAMAKERAE